MSEESAEGRCVPTLLPLRLLSVLLPQNHTHYLLSWNQRLNHLPEVVESKLQEVSPQLFLGILCISIWKYLVPVSFEDKIVDKGVMVHQSYEPLSLGEVGCTIPDLQNSQLT